MLPKESHQTHGNFGPRNDFWWSNHLAASDDKLEPSAELCLPKWSIVQRELFGITRFFVAYPQLPPHQKRNKRQMRDKETLCQYKESVNKWAPSTKSLKRNNYSEIPNKKMFFSKKTLKTKKYWPCNNPWVNCWCLWPILPVWLRKQTPLASDMDQSPFQKCSEKNLRSGKGISSLFQGSKNSGFPFCNCYPCVATWNPPLCPARFFAHGRHWMKQTSFFHVFPRGHSNTNTTEYICPQCTQCKYINKYIYIQTFIYIYKYICGLF